jgi:tetratricopeptide (TPR) repeat protein
MKKILVTLLITCSIFLNFTCSKNNEELDQKYKLAIGYYYKKDLKLSLKLLSEIYEQNPNYKDVKLYLGKIYYFGGKFKEADEFFSAAAKQDLHNINSKVWLVKTKYALASSKENFENIINVSEQILEKDSSNLEILSLLSKVYFKNGDIEKSINAYKKIISYSDELALAHFELGKIYQEAGIKKESEKHIRRARILSENNINIKKAVINFSMEEENEQKK